MPPSTASPLVIVRGELPSASLLPKDPSSMSSTLLNKNTVLTASHCFGFTGQPTYVRVGDTDLVSSAGRLSQLQLKREKKDLKNCFVKKNIEKIGRKCALKINKW